MKPLKIWLYLFFAVVVLALFGGCATSYYGYKNTKRGVTVPDNKILVIAKAGFDVDPSVLFKIPADKSSELAWQSLIAEYAPVDDGDMASINADFRGFPVSWGEYKAVLIPRTDVMSIRDLAYMPMAVVTGDAAITDYNIIYERSLVARFRKNDRVVYIGDIFHSFLKKNELGQQDTQVEIKDNFLKVNNMFKGYAVDKNGSPLPVVKRLIRLDGWVGFVFDSIKTITVVTPTYY